MEIKQFVEETLTQILDGVLSAKNNVSRSKETGVITSSLTYSEIDFDIAVAIEETGLESDTKIKVLGYSARTSGEEISKNKITSRLKFSVPVGYPNTKKTTEPITTEQKW
ncbi:MAG: hypothetical protein GY804_01525 [Alphaproteobacteria bacterium]|nr:hypothetical protein [Alphaproteobacteria bacterium]